MFLLENGQLRRDLYYLHQQNVEEYAPLACAKLLSEEQDKVFRYSLAQSLANITYSGGLRTSPAKTVEHADSRDGKALEFDVRQRGQIAIGMPGTVRRLKALRFTATTSNIIFTGIYAKDCKPLSVKPELLSAVVFDMKKNLPMADLIDNHLNRLIYVEDKVGGVYC